LEAEQAAEAALKQKAIKKEADSDDSSDESPGGANSSSFNK
jgi:hypothetical protein